MPTNSVIGVRVVTRYDGAATASVREINDGRGFERLDSGTLDVYGIDARVIATFQPDGWTYVELICEPEPEPASEGSPFTWPYDPLSGTVSTGDAVEQAKHEAADHIAKARVDAAAKAVRDAQADQASAMRRYAQAIADAQRHLAELHDELGDAA